MTQHERHRQDGGQRVGLVLAGDVGGAAVHRLVHAYLAAEAGRRQHADGAGEHGGLVAQDVAEHVGGDDDVELPGVADELHGAVVHQHVVELHVAVTLLVADARHHLAPQLGGFQHVGLVHRGHPAPPAAGGVEGHPGDAFDLRSGVDQGVDAPFAAVGLGGDALGVPEVDAAGQFAHDHEVRPLHHLGLEGRGPRQRREQLDRPQVGEQPQLLAQRQQGPLRTDGVVQPVPLGSAHGSQHHRVAGLGHGQDIIGQGFPVGIDGRAAHQPLLHVDGEAENIAHLAQHRHGLRHHFRADAVARKHRYLMTHGPPSTEA